MGLSYPEYPPAHVTVGPYIDNVYERCLMFHEFQSASEFNINGVGLAFIMVAPIESLRVIKTQVRAFSGFARRRQAVRSTIALRGSILVRHISEPQICRDMLAYVGKLPSAGPPAPAKAQVATCIATRAPTTNFVNILEVGSGTPETRAAEMESLLSKFKGFWSPEQITTWYDSILAAKQIENLRVPMTASLGCLWFKKAAFALKPIKKLDDRIWVAWHWLKRSGIAPHSVVESQVELEEAGLTNPDWGHSHGDDDGDDDDDDGLAGRPPRIRTGQVFEIRPVNGEMPSYELLELQWILVRVAAISGTCAMPDGYDGEPDDDEYGIDDSEMD